MTAADLRVEIAVLGAGVAGAAIAWELAGRGRRVALLASPDDALAPGLGHVLTGPGEPYVQAVRRLGRDAARTAWECGRENGDRLRGFVEGRPGSCGYERRGGFLLAGDRAEGMALADSEDMLRDDGFPGEFLDHYMLEARFDVSGFAGAYWAADDAEVDPARLVVALSAAAAERGAQVRPPVHPPVVELDASGAAIWGPAGRVRADWLVVATDALPDSVAPFVEAPVRREAVHGLTAALTPGPALPSPARTADGALAWQVAGERLVAAAPAPGGPPVPPGLAERLHARPGSATAWEARVGRSPDGRPLIGLLPARPLALASGFGGLAPSLAFMAARWIGEALTLGEDPTPGVFRASRTPGEV